jgi:hypothetical protein
MKGFRVSFVSLNDMQNGELRRYITLDQEIQINTAHPDFKNKLKTKLGKPQFSDRLCSYLASIIAVQYNSKVFLFNFSYIFSVARQSSFSYNVLPHKKVYF